MVASDATRDAETRKVAASNQRASFSWFTSRRVNSPKSPSQEARLANKVKTSDAMGKLPYAAAIDSEFAAASFSGGTSRGTDASFAGDHIKVRHSRTKEIAISPATVSTNGIAAVARARPTSHTIIVCRRSQRSTSTPPRGARKNPGTRRAAKTNPTAPGPPETRSATTMMARRPIQSPRLETACATQRRKNVDVPNTRQGAGGNGPDPSEVAGTNGAESLLKACPA